MKTHDEAWQLQWTAFAESAHWQLMSPADWERFFALTNAIAQIPMCLGRMSER